MSDESIIRELLPLARAKAARVGPMHTLWDVIIDCEELLAGRKAAISDLAVLRQMLEESLKPLEDRVR